MTLERVLDLVPAGPMFVIPLLAKNTPHKSASLAQHVFYIRNLLRIIGYVPNIRRDVLAIVVDTLVQIDV